MASEQHVSKRGGLLTEYREVPIEEWGRMRDAVKTPADREMIGLLFGYNGNLPARLVPWSRLVNLNRVFRKVALPYRVRSTKWGRKPQFYRLHTICL